MARVTSCKGCGESLIDDSSEHCRACSAKIIEEIGQRFTLFAQIRPGESVSICPCCDTAIVRPSVVTKHDYCMRQRPYFFVNVLYECDECEASWADFVDAHPGYTWLDDE